MYADDTSSLNGTSTVKDITRNFIPDIKNVMDWLKANNLTLNVMKTEFILTGTVQSILKIGDLLAIRVQGHTIKRVYKAKYLGIVIDNKLTWKDHIDHVSLKIFRSSPNFRSNLNRPMGLPLVPSVQPPVEAIKRIDQPMIIANPFLLQAKTHR